MHFSNHLLKFYLMFELLIIIGIKCENNMNTNQLTADDFEKRRSVKEFFDSLVAGSNQNTKTSSHNSSPSTPRPDGPIYMPFAVPVHSPPPPPPGPHVHIAPPPSFGYSSNINSIYRPPPHSHPHSHPPHPRPHLHMSPMGQGYGPPHHHHNHNHNHNGYSPMPPINQNFGAQSHHYPIPLSPHSPYNHFEFGQHSRPIAIAIPLPLHAIPLHLIPHNEDNHKQNNFMPTPDFSDDMSPTTKFALFADPFEEVAEEDLFDNSYQIKSNQDNSNQRFKFVPVPKTDSI